MGTKVSLRYGVKNSIDEATGRISITSQIAGDILEEVYETKEKQMEGALIRLGWIPPDDSAEMMKHLNDLIWIREYADQPSLANQGQAMDGYSMLAHYNGLADKVLATKSKVINRYLIRRNKDETREDRL